MTRAEVLRKSLIIFDALRRVSSKGNAGLEALPGAEESFQTDAEICRVLREWLREMESGVPENLAKPKSVTYKCRMTREEFDELLEKVKGGKDTGTIFVPYGPLDQRPEPDTLGNMLQGNPLMTEETIQAARRMDEARDRIIERTMQGPLDVEPNVPKVVDLKEWQRIAAEKPPERLDFDE